VNAVNFAEPTAGTVAPSPLAANEFVPKLCKNYMDIEKNKQICKRRVLIAHVEH
jgi:hypothetical protein